MAIKLGPSATKHGLAFMVAALICDHEDGEDLAHFVLDTFRGNYAFDDSPAMSPTDARQALTIGRAALREMKRNG
jgi:hypothetical protein